MACDLEMAPVASMRVEKPAAIAPAIGSALDVTPQGAPFLLEFIVKEGYDFSRYTSWEGAFP